MKFQLRASVLITFAAWIGVSSLLADERVKEKATLREHMESVNYVAFSPDGKTLASAGWDGTIVLWDVALEKKKATLNLTRFRPGPLAFSPDSKTLASVDGGYRVNLWDVATLKRRTFGEIEQACAEVFPVFSADGKTLITGGPEYGAIRVWDVAAGKVKDRIEVESVVAMAYKPDGKTLCTLAYDEGIRLWDVATWKSTSTAKITGNSFAAAAFSPDCKSIAAATEEKKLAIFEVATGKQLATLEGKYSGRCLVFSPDGKTLAYGSDMDIKLCEAVSGKEKSTLTGHTDTIWSLAFSPDGKMLASACFDTTVKLWDVAPKK